MADTIRKRVQIALEGGYTSGSGSVYNGGSAVGTATRRLAVEESTTFDIDPVYESANEARGGYAGVYQHTYQMASVKGKLAALIYPDDLYYLGKMALSGAPTFITLPATPQVLLAATAIAATMSALTTQPNATADAGLSKCIAVTLSNASANTTAVNISVIGTDINNVAITETLNFTLGTTTASATGGGTGAISCTLYTRNFFKTVTSVTCSAQPSGDLVAIGGLNGFYYTYPLDLVTSTLQSASAQYYDGSASWLIAGLVLEKIGFNFVLGKSSKIDATAIAQSKVPLAANANSINTGAQNGDFNALTLLADAAQLYAIGTNIGRFYADPFGTAPGTTLVNSRLIDYKANFDMAPKFGKTADATGAPSFVGREAYGSKTTADLTMLFNSYLGNTVDPVELNAFLNQQSRTSRMAFAGPYLPCGPLSTAGNWPTHLLDGSGKAGAYGVSLDFAGKYTKLAEKTDNGRTAYSYTVESEVDLVSMGVPAQVGIVSRINPNV